MIAMPASSISTLGAITPPRPASWRWAITTARRDCRGSQRMDPVQVAAAQILRRRSLRDLAVESVAGLDLDFFARRGLRRPARSPRASDCVRYHDAYGEGGVMP
jgi:hypothetical protein